jgi:hypothetical protein
MTEFIPILMLEEVRRVVADAVERRATLSAHDAAEQIGRTHPNSKLSKREIAAEIMIAAARAGVPVVDLGTPRAA